MPDLSSEIFFRTARSGGKGGQNVNKVETMAEAWWQVAQSRLFTEDEKILIRSKLHNRINKDGYLTVRSSESRSQLENKQIAQRRMEELVVQSLVKPQIRKKLKPTRAMIEKRLDSKKKNAEKKQLRGRRDFL